MKSILILSLVTVLCGLVSVASAQEKLRSIVAIGQESSPAAVVNVSKGDKLFGRSSGNAYEIMGDHDWIPQLTFDVKNVSNKNITYINLLLDIPKTGKMVHNGRIVQFVFGNRTASAIANKDSSSSFKSLKPGDMAKIKISDSERANLEAYFKKYDVQDVQRTETDIREVHFEDGTGWIYGNEIRQDLLDSTKWRPVRQGQMTNQMSPSIWTAAVVPIYVFGF